jgi:hypothetical protein
MAVKAPFMRTATLAEIRPVATDFPVAIAHPALTVAETSEGGTHADAEVCSQTSPPVVAKPWRARRFASSFLPLASRPATVPWGQPSCCAAFLMDLPSRSHKRIGSR